MSKYVFDLDGTLCTFTNGNYFEALPINYRISQLNELYEKGHYIVIATARGMGSSGNNKSVAEEKWLELTKKQLQEWEISYHELHMGKPAGDIYIDDKGISDKDFFDK